MGGSQSARRLTINNEDGVIQISTDLVERLTHSNRDVELPVSSDAAASDGKATEAAQVYDTNNNDTQSNIGRSISPPPLKSELPNQQYLAPVHPEYTITAYKIQQQKEIELQAQHEYWQKRLYNLKLTHDKINKVFQDEYKKAVDEISNSQGKKNINYNSVVPPCGSDKAKVLQCYQENPREILKCASVVDEFNSCVDQRRANIIAARC